jgi:hypothetical protein
MLIPTFHLEYVIRLWNGCILLFHYPPLEFDPAFLEFSPLS